MKNFIVRACSGIVYVAIIITLLLLGGDYGFPALCILFSALGALELFHMEDNGAPLSLTRCFDLLVVMLIAAIPLMLNCVWIPLAAVATIPLIAIIARMVVQLYSHHENPAAILGTSFLSYSYIGLTLALTGLLFDLYGSAITLTMFAMIWLNDTGAYLVGCTLGRHRLFERLSPKKSWEGFFGGLLFSVATGITAYYLGVTAYNIWHLATLGAVVTAFATWGDLMESMLKRAAGVKDSGHLIPGHGGILDRIDSLLFVGPITLVVITLYCLL